MTSRSGGLSKARLGRMRDVMTAHVERGDIPGLVTLVSRRDEVHVEAIGRSRRRWADAARHDLPHRVYHDFWTQAYQAIDD